MKKLVLLILCVVSFTTGYSQQQQYNFTDSTWESRGFWTNNLMYSQKDSLGASTTTENFWKFYTNIFATRLTSNFNDGTPVSIVWTTNDGWFKRSPISSIYIGTASQYIKGDGTYSTFPTIPTNTNQLTNGSGYITTSGARSAISLTTLGTGVSTYNSSTGILNIPTPSGTTTPTYNNSVTRPINSTSFTPSSTQPYRVFYNIEISCSATIGGAASGSVVLQYYNGTSWINTAGVIKNSNTVTLAIVVGSTTIQGGTLSGEFPTNTPLRLVSTSSGTTTITYNTGQEILY